VIFTNQTFYKDTKSKANLVLSIVIILGIIQIIFHIINESSLYYIRVSLDVPFTFIVFNWLAFSAYRVYKKIKNENIQPWIKVRYKLIIISSFIISFYSIIEFFQPSGISWGDPSHPISVIVFGLISVLAIIFSVGFSFSFLMPKFLKNYFNRNFNSLDETQFSEDELNIILRNNSDKNK
jgi:amino acid transporter